LLITTQKQSDFYLFLEFITLACCILIGSWFQKNGFLSADAVNYLALANNLIENYDFYVSGYGYSGNERDFFAIWPVGYPLLIAFMAKMTGLPVFWASKIVNIALAGFTLLIFRRIFSVTAHIYGMLFLFGAGIVIYTFTWSEALFIFAITGYATAMAYAIKSSDSLIKSSALILLFSLLLFLARYIGAITIISTGFLGLYAMLKLKNRQKAMMLIIIAAINTGFVIAYLYNNLTLTHYLTGMPRIPAPESHLELIQQLLLAIISELIITIPYLFFRPEFFVIIIIQVLCFLFFFRKTPNHKNNAPRLYCIYSLTFLYVGSFYIISIVALRWMTHFDAFFFRLLFPGSILIFAGIMRHIEINQPERFQQLSKTLCALTLLTVVLILTEIVGKSDSTYGENISAIEAEYAGVPSGSVVAFGSMHLKYLRHDILLWSPWSFPYNHKKESWSDFVNRAGKNRHIFLAFPEDELIEKNYDLSVMQLLEKQKGKNVTQIQ
jgi:hypothetical protein